MIRQLSALFAVALTAAAPSPSSDVPADVVRALLNQDQEVAAIGYRLVTANAELCARRVVESGMTIGTLAQYDARYRAAAAATLGMTTASTVELVVPGSPADKAGIRARDVLVAADGTAFAPVAPRSDRGSFGPVDAAMAVLDAALADGHAELVVERGGQRMTVGLAGAAACRSRFQVAGDDLDAFVTDTIWIKLSPQVIDFSGTHDGLAAVMAHELAHNVLGHTKAKIASVQRAQELQADRLMPWLMARAGFDPRAAAAVWRQFEAKRVGGLFPDGTHPGWSARVAAIDVELARIAALSSRAGTIVPPDDLKSR